MKGKSHNFRGQSCEEMETAFYAKMEKLTNNQSDFVDKILVIPECIWNEFKKTHTPARDFMTTFVVRPLQRLVARDACK